MSQVKFYTGSEIDLNDKAIEEGAIYFVEKDGNPEAATVAFDMDNERHYVRNHYSIVQLSDLNQQWTPKAGEIIIVTDAMRVNNEDTPLVKIGNGNQNSVELPYIGCNDNNDFLKIHFEDYGEIHHYITAPTVTQSGDRHILTITPVSMVLSN